MSNNKVLGRGIAAFIADVENDDLKKDKSNQAIFNVSNNMSESIDHCKDQSVKMINTNLIKQSKFQPRSFFNKESIDELALSIKKNGVLQPIILRKSGEYYEIIAGERRWRASIAAGLTEIPSIIRNITDKELLSFAIIENIQREDLNPIEEAVSYQKLIDEFNYTQEMLSDVIGKSRSHIANLLRVLSLPEDVKKMIVENVISFSHAKMLVGIENNNEIAEAIKKNNLSVKETEKLIKNSKKIKIESKTKEQEAANVKQNSNVEQNSRNSDMDSIAINLTKTLNTKVGVDDSKITIFYDDFLHLDSIIKLITGSII